MNADFREIDSKVKNLYAFLKKYDIEKYFLSKNFKITLMELNLDNQWEEIKRMVVRESGVSVLIPGFTGYVDKAFLYLINSIYIISKKYFLPILDVIIINFLETENIKKFDFEQLNKRLSHCGFKNDELDEMKILKWKLERNIPEVEIKLDENGNFMINYADKYRLGLFKGEFKRIKNLIFVLLPFENKFNQLFRDYIERPLKKKGYEVKKADDFSQPREIIRDIWQTICEAEIIIADLTNRNPNVFYELGMAHALGKYTILMTQDINSVPFDLKHTRIIEYRYEPDGFKKLKIEIQKAIKAKDS